MRRGPVIALAVCGLLALAWGALWLWSADRLETLLADWHDDQRQRGITLDYDGPVWSGFPLALSSQFAKPHVASRQGLAWRGPTIEASISPLQPLVSRWRAPGRHEIELPGRAGSASVALPEGITVDAAGLQAEVGLDGRGKLEKVELEGSGLVVLAAGYEPVEAAELALAAGPLVEKGEALTLPLTLRIRDLALPETLIGELPGLIKNLTADITLLGPEPQSDDPEEILRQWSAGRGVARIDRVGLLWAGLDLRASGHLGLDAALRPSGRLDLRADGIGQLAQVLVEAGAINRNEALGLTLAALGLQRTNPETGAKEVAVPLILENGEARLGPIRLGRVPSLLEP